MAQTNSEANVWVNKNHPSQPRKAPATQVGVLGWLRSNLFQRHRQYPSDPGLFGADLLTWSLA